MNSSRTSLFHFLMFLMIGNLIRQVTAATTKPTTRATTASPPDKLNVVLFITDDGGVDNFRSINNEHSFFDWAHNNTVRFRKFSSGVPVCAPSRDEIFSGRTAGRLNWVTFDSNGLNVVKNAGGRTLPGEFATEKGYITTARGKGLHPNRDQVMNAWGEYTISAISNTEGANAECKQQKIACVKENSLDRLTSNQCKALLTQFSNSGKPFFLVCGFNRPHMPWTTTQRNYNLARADIPLENTNVAVTADLIRALQKNKEISLPIRVPKMNNSTIGLNIHNFFASKRIGSMRVPMRKSGGKTWKKITDLPGAFANKKIDFPLLLKYHRASLATTLDYIKSVIDTIYSLGLDKNTIIVFTGDHGVGINQMAFDVAGNPTEGFLSKNRLYSQISDVLTLFYVPGITNITPGVTDVPATSVDLFNTIISLALHRTPQPSSLRIDGKDLSPWIKNPKASSDGLFRIIQYPRGPRWQPQDETLMAGDQCHISRPLGGRPEWCNMEYKITQVINGKEYQLFVAFDFYEVRSCANAGPATFEPGEKYWQITPKSCVDLKSAADLMLFSDDPDDLGKNLLFGNPTYANQKIANDLLKTLTANRAYEGCAEIPKLASSRCTPR